MSNAQRSRIPVIVLIPTIILVSLLIFLRYPKYALFIQVWDWSASLNHLLFSGIPHTQYPTLSEILTVCLHLALAAVMVFLYWRSVSYLGEILTALVAALILVPPVAFYVGFEEGRHILVAVIATLPLFIAGIV